MTSNYIIPLLGTTKVMALRRDTYKMLIKKEIACDKVHPCWKEIIKQVQTSIRFAPTRILNNNSPAELMFRYNPRTIYNNIYNKIKQETIKNKIRKNSDILKLGYYVWKINQLSRSLMLVKATFL